ncbi:MAG: 50S ribosomal protein L35, partial [Anaerolineaceae bacterium]|nr:50S ribosomal protein L35 [Anaerolineaceae bacterium]
MKEENMSPRKKRKKKYKIKTHKATAKRFRKSGSGKIMRTKGRKSHLRRRKSKRAKRMFTRMHEVKSRGIKRRVKKLAPN